MNDLQEQVKVEHAPTDKNEHGVEVSNCDPQRGLRYKTGAFEFEAHNSQTNDFNMMFFIFTEQ